VMKYWIDRKIVARFQRFRRSLNFEFTSLVIYLEYTALNKTKKAPFQAEWIVK
jgi:hypothetical protein